MKSAIKAPKIKQVNIIISILNTRNDVPLIMFDTILMTIKTNIKQPVINSGLFHFRQAYRISIPIMNGIKHPIIMPIAFHIRSPLCSV